MQANKAKDTGPERELGRLLWANGLRGYRKNFKGVTGKPDFFFRRYNLAVFVNGCFWHRCPKCKLVMPKTNTQFWMDKFERNVKRDQRISNQLHDDGFRVVTIWECEIKAMDKMIISRIKKAIPKISQTNGKGKNNPKDGKKKT